LLAELGLTREQVGLYDPYDKFNMMAAMEPWQNRGEV
jgi:hypothetical protein